MNHDDDPNVVRSCGTGHVAAAVNIPKDSTGRIPGGKYFSPVFQNTSFDRLTFYSAEKIKHSGSKFHTLQSHP